MAEKSCHYSSPLPSNSMHIIKVCAKIKWITYHIFHCKILRTWECDFIPNAVNTLTHQPAPQIDCYCDNKIFYFKYKYGLLTLLLSILQWPRRSTEGSSSSHHCLSFQPYFPINLQAPPEKPVCTSRACMAHVFTPGHEVTIQLCAQCPFFKHTSSTSLISKLYLP